MLVRKWFLVQTTANFHWTLTLIGDSQAEIPPWATASTSSYGECSSSNQFPIVWPHVPGTAPTVKPFPGYSRIYPAWNFYLMRSLPAILLGGTGGGGWMHQKGANSKAVSWLRITNTLVGSGWATSRLLCKNRLTKQSDQTVWPCTAPISVQEAFSQSGWTVASRDPWLLQVH